MTRVFALGILPLLVACAGPSSTVAMRVGQEVGGQRLLETQQQADVYLDVLFLAGEGVTTVETSHSGEGLWALTWTAGAESFGASVQMAGPEDARVARVEPAQGEAQEFLLSSEAALVLRLHADGQVGVD